jgi:endonuclease/exonuclease/phosphatase (EEP) superfamily protein YafD
VVGGDLNTLLGPLETALGELRRHDLVAAPVTGGPRLLPVVDRILARGATVLDGRLLPGAGSDHRPVLAVLEL